MVPRKILWLWVLDNDNNYALFGFAGAKILPSLATRLIVVTNIQVITLFNFV